MFPTATPTATTIESKRNHPLADSGSGYLPDLTIKIEWIVYHGRIL